jgi:gas vesicle protein
MAKDPTTNSGPSQIPDHHFLIGFLTGGFVAGLTMLFAPRVAAELRQRVTDSARNLGRAASEGYQKASTRAGGAVDDLTKKGQGVRDEVLEAVATGAQKVERFATEHTTSGRHAR